MLKKQKNIRRKYKSKRNKKQDNKINNQNIKVNTVLTVITVITTFISLTISIAAYNISKSSLNVSKSSLEVSKSSLEVSEEALDITDRNYILSSEEFHPNIDFEVDTEDKIVTVINNSNDIFKIESVSILGISVFGLEEYVLNREIQIPQVSLSKFVVIPIEKRSEKSLLIDLNDTSMLAYIRPDKELLDKFRKKLDDDYNLESESGYALPMLNTYYYLIEVDYSDQFNNYKSCAYKYIHLHGAGEWKKIKIDNDEKEQIIEACKLPKKDNFDELWEYIINNPLYITNEYN